MFETFAAPPHALDASMPLAVNGSVSARGDVVLASATRQQWSALAAEFLDYNHRQLWAYGELLAAKRRARSEHIVITRGGEVRGLADVRVRTLPFGLGGMAYVSWGPMFRLGVGGPGEHEDGQRFTDCLRALRREYVDRRKLLLRLDLAPALAGPAYEHVDCERRLTNAGFSPSPHFRLARTILVDLAPDLDAIRKQLHQKWRNALNQSEKHGLTIRTGDTDSIFHEFSELYEKFETRKGFVVDLAAPFYEDVQRQSIGPERAFVSLVEHHGHVIAGHVAVMAGDTSIYLLGASSQQGRVLKAAYLLQWHAIQAAKRRGMRWYDAGGIDPVSIPGVCHFKRGLGGHELEQPGPYECAPAGLPAKITRAAEKAYTFARGLRRSRILAK